MDTKNPRTGVKTRSTTQSSTTTTSLATNMADVNKSSVQDSLTDYIDDTLCQLKAELKDEKQKVRSLTYELEHAKLRILHLETYSRKQNVIIEGFDEHEGEQIPTLVTNFFTKKMHLPPAIAEDIDKVHRYGRSMHGRPRPIIVRFTKISSRDSVLRNVKHLRDARSKVYVNEDLPVEVKNQRADLRAIATHAKHQGIEAKVQGDTLIMENRKHSSEDLDLLPKNLQLSAARTPKVSDNVVGFYIAAILH